MSVRYSDKNRITLFLILSHKFRSYQIHIFSDLGCLC
nr:MAG TPA: hypothetical protein [Caudoviricetes sp.]